MTAALADFSSLRTLVDLLRWRAQHDPYQRAYIFLADGEVEESSVTYAELDRQARAIAAWLQVTTGPGERALLFYPPGLRYIASFFGCLYAGIIAVPAYPPQPNRTLQRIETMAIDAEATLALAQEPTRTALKPLFDSSAALQGIGLETPPEGDDGHHDWRVPSLSGDTLAMLQYTSGSTGTPRGVMVAHDNLMNNLAAMAYAFEGTPRGAVPSGFHLDPAQHCGVVSWLPPYHDMGLIGGILLPLYAGRPAALMPPAPFLQRPVRWLQAISRYRATYSIGPNFAFDLCVRRITPEQRSQLSLDGWEMAICGAEPIRAESLHRFASTFAGAGFRPAAFYPCYGLAEATLMVAGRQAGQAMVTKTLDSGALERNRVVDADGGADARIVVGCGRAVLDQRIVIVRPEESTLCPPGEVGEIWVSGPSVASGYWNRPEGSTQTFQARIIPTGEGPYLRTGDLGFLDGGELFVTGRIDDVIIVRGRNHYPHDIEASVERSHPALRPNAGVAFAVEVDGEYRLVIVHEVERPLGIDVEEVAGAVRQAVAEGHELQVADVVLVRPGSIPKTSSGKLQRRACRANYLASALPVVGVWRAIIARERSAPAPEATPAPLAGRERPTKDEIELWLVTKLGERLGVDARHIDVDQPLARHGLDSKEAVVLASELEEWLGVSLPVTLAYEYPTIDLLSRYLAGETLPARASDGHERNWASAEPIAIIGIGCRYPGADDVEAFWGLLSGGVDAVREVPADRWDARALYDPNPSAPGRMNTRWGGFLERVDLFDPHAFGISPREAACMDPQQRLLLEVAWEALDDAGQPAHGLARSSTGVFMGISSNDYGQSQFGAAEAIDAYAGTGNSLSMGANRLSYQFDLRGPSIVVDTACSSSLVAVHLACQSLRHGHCRLALAGGVNVMLAPAVTVSFSKAGFMAPDGRCKAFDARANGYVRGEGAGVVVLKPLSSALADGDSIYAVILGSAVNSDGRTNGLTAPSREAQEAVLHEAYRDADIAPSRVRYVEAHGTGTALGDPIEVRALANVLGGDRSGDRWCLLGSVKTNIGHLEAAAGIAGLIKAALSLHWGQIPPSLHFQEPNPAIPFDELPFRVAQSLSGWPDGDGPPVAGVSAFGFGGTNAHVVLEEAPRFRPRGHADAVAAPPEPTAAQLLPLSAHSRDALDDLARAYLDVVASDDSRAPVALVDLCHSASELRSHHDHRLGVVARSRDEAAAGLRSFLRREPRRSAVVGRRTYGRAPKLAFVFSGQGSQWQGMGRTLLAREPVFRATLTECDEFVTRRTGWSLLSELTADEAESRMHETAIAQPTLVAMQIALAALWRSWGIEPAAVVGHSVGEIAAAAVSGALTLPDALQVAIQRGRIMQRATGRGRMAAVALGLADAWDAVLGYRHVVSVAASNSPVASVLSGETAALERMLARLSERGVGHRWLPMSYAFHSMQMQPFEAELAGILAGLEPQVTAVPMYSTLTGDLCAGRDLDASYWGRQLRSPVLFAAAIDALLAAAHETFVELSPDPVLAAPIAQCLRAQERAGRVLPSLRRGEDDRTTLLETLGALYVTGYHVDWASLLPSGCRRIRLPNYPWQRERHWIDGPRPAAPTRPNIGGNRNGEDHPLLGREVTIAPAAGIRIWELELESRRLPYLSDHRIDGAILLPVAAYIEMALAAAAEVFAREPCSLADVVLERPLTVSDAAAHTVQIIVTQSGHRDADFHICSHPPRGESGGVSWTLHARGRVRRG